MLSSPNHRRHCLPGKWTEVRVWQCQPCPTRLVHRTGLLQLPKARTRMSFSIARMQVGVCWARVQAGLRLRSGHHQRGAPPPAPGDEAGLGSRLLAPPARAQVASAGTRGCFLLHRFPGLEAEAPADNAARAGTITTRVHGAPGPHRGLSGLNAAPRAGRSPPQEARVLRTGP